MDQLHGDSMGLATLEKLSTVVGSPSTESMKTLKGHRPAQFHYGGFKRVTKTTTMMRREQGVRHHCTTILIDCYLILPCCIMCLLSLLLINHHHHHNAIVYCESLVNGATQNELPTGSALLQTPLKYQWAQVQSSQSLRPVTLSGSLTEEEEAKSVDHLRGIRRSSIIRRGGGNDRDANFMQKHPASFSAKWSKMISRSEDQRVVVFVESFPLPQVSGSESGRCSMNESIINNNNNGNGQQKNQQPPKETNFVVENPLIKVNNRPSTSPLVLTTITSSVATPTLSINDDNKSNDTTNDTCINNIKSINSNKSNSSSNNNNNNNEAELELEETRIRIGVTSKKRSARNKRRAHIPGKAPSFATPIGNMTAIAGRDVRLICTVDNLGHYQVAWMKLESKTILSIDTNIITTNYRIFLIPDEEERKWVLHIKDVQESDRGFYQCQLNTVPMRSITGHLEVVVPPTIVESQSTQQMTIDEYSNVTLTCKTSAHPKATTTWKRDDGLPIRLNGRPNQITPVSDQSDQISSNDQANSEDYHMTVTDSSEIRDNSAYSASHNINDNNNKANDLDKADTDSNNSDGPAHLISSQASILDPGKFGAQSFPLGAISIGKIRPTPAPIVISSSIETQYKSEKLTLTYANRTFSGVYSCTSSNGIPPAATKKIPLYINFPPKTSLLNQYISANIGDPIDLECIIEAYPKPSNHWAKVPSGDLTRVHVFGSYHGGMLLDDASGGQQPSTTKNEAARTAASDIHITYHPHNRLNNRSIQKRYLSVTGDTSHSVSDHDVSINRKELPNRAIASIYQSDQSSILEGINGGAFVSVKQNNINSYTYQLKLTIPSLRRQDFGKYTCFSRNNLGASESSVLVREVSKTPEYLPQRPSNVIQSDYPTNQHHQISQTSMKNHSKSGGSTIQRNFIRTTGNQGYTDHPMTFGTNNKIVYDEKYIQAIKARQQNLNQDNNLNIDKTIQRLKLKNAQNGSQTWRKITGSSFVLLIILSSLLLLATIS